MPEIPYESVPNFLKFPPGLYMGEAMGVATNSKGHIFVYTRSANTRLFEFDQNGNYVREIGEGNYGFEFAHSVRVDSEDNIWAVDEGTNMVIKFNPAGRVVMVLGHRPDAVAGAGSAIARTERARREVHTRAPDRCRVGPAGQHFRLGRIHQSQGGEVRQERQVPQAGGQRESPGRNPASSTRRTGSRWMRKGNVYVADRANHRMQVFDNNLGPKAIYDNIGDSWTVCISPGPHQYLFTSNSNPNGNTPGSWDITGEIYKMELDGTILGRFGHASKEFGGFQVVHMMDCRNPNEIIVAEIESWRVQKLILKPQAAKSFGEIGKNRRPHEKPFCRFFWPPFSFPGCPPAPSRPCLKSPSIPPPIR